MKWEGSKGHFYRVSYPDGRLAYISKSIAKPETKWRSELKMDAQSIIRTAYTMIGIPYLWAQAETLLCFINNIDENIELTKKLTSAYMTQDLAAMEKISDGELCSMTPQEKTNMIDNRNQKWVKALPEIMKTAPTFIAVGALHLPGENGVLNLLKKQGYAVDPVK